MLIGNIHFKLFAAAAANVLFVFLIAGIRFSEGEVLFQPTKRLFVVTTIIWAIYSTLPITLSEHIMMFLLFCTWFFIVDFIFGFSEASNFVFVFDQFDYFFLHLAAYTFIYCIMKLINHIRA